MSLQAELAELAGEAGPLEPEVAWALVRKAYGQGYVDALAEEEPDPDRARERLLEALARLPVQ